MDRMELPMPDDCERIVSLPTDGTVDRVLFVTKHRPWISYRLSIPNIGENYADPEHWILEREGEVIPVRLQLVWPNDKDRTFALVCDWSGLVNRLDLARKQHDDLGELMDELMDGLSEREDL